MILLLLFSACTRWDGLAARNTVEEYCRLDYEGARISSRNKELLRRYFELTTWQVEPGWDESAIVSSYSVGPPRGAGDKADIDVAYSVVGLFLGGEYVTVASVQETNKYSLAWNGTSWQITGGRIPPHVSVPTFKHHLQNLIATQSDKAYTTKLQSILDQLQFDAK
jgi:hypothetical protein